MCVTPHFFYQNNLQFERLFVVLKSVASIIAIDRKIKYGKFCNMIIPRTPEDEVNRLGALRDYSILDTMPEKEYDDITFLASQICKTPISLISLIDDKRQWFKSNQGLNATETPRDLAFCAHAINDKNNILIVPNAEKDERFHDNPLVVNEPHVIFYAGVPLVDKEGFALGTLCVIDNQPNSLDEFQLKTLKALANQIMSLFELRKKSMELESKIYEMEAQNEALEKFASIAAHDIKSPLATIVMLADLVENTYSHQLDADGQELIKLIYTSATNLTHFIEGILEYSRNTKLLEENKELINLKKVVTNLILLIDPNKEVKFDIHDEANLIVFTNKVAIEQILINLLVNGIKYNDKSEIIISLKIEDIKDFVKFNIVDNGPGIKKENQQRIFRIFETASTADRTGDKGNGIGLATVKSLVEGLGGTISLSSEIGKGANFEFTIRK